MVPVQTPKSANLVWSGFTSTHQRSSVSRVSQFKTVLHAVSTLPTPFSVTSVQVGMRWVLTVKHAWNVWVAVRSVSRPRCLFVHQAVDCWTTNRKLEHANLASPLASNAKTITSALNALMDSLSIKAFAIRAASTPTNATNANTLHKEASAQNAKSATKWWITSV